VIEHGAPHVLDVNGCDLLEEPAPACREDCVSAPPHPDWYHNVKANSNVSVEVGTDQFDAVATEVTGDERDRFWEAQKHEFPQFAGYEASTPRTIPVVALSPA
jgi:deazaflavin-dependent oxidoreductase (nitroreductase family)